MGTTLTGTTPQDTYDSLIKVTDNGPLSGSLKKLTDGLGNDSALSLSTGAASVTGTLAVSSGITSTGANTMLSASSSTEGLVVRGGSSIGTASTASGQILIGQTGTYRGSIAYDDNAGYLYIDNLYNNNAGNIYFRTKTQATAVEALTILGSGNVGIGTSSPASYSKLQVKVGTDFNLAIGQDTGALGLGAYNDALNANADLNITGANIKFSSGGERMRITSDGYVRLSSGAGGLQFNGDTAAANALDDYEEGTWTMGVSFGGASVGVTYSTNAGLYTKIGRQVTVTGLLVLSSKGTSTGDAKITGLPFTVGGANGNYGSFSWRVENVSFADYPSGYVDAATTTIALQEVTNAGVATPITNADFTDSANIVIQATYFV